MSELSYDATGNILALNRNNEMGRTIDQLNYNYSGTNRLQSVGDAHGSTPSLDWDAEPASFDYDPNGNLIAHAENSADSTLFDYDHRNLPLKATLPDGRSARFRYTADGQRYLKEASGEETFYILDGPQTLAVMKEDTLRWWNITGQGIEGRRDAESDSVRYYLKDHLGSTRAVVDKSGEVLESFDYYPFGLLMPKRNTTGAGTMEKFTGKERDEAIGLDYFGARYYDAALGRWHGVDPLADEYSSWSPYNYALNNPLRFNDPTGLCPEEFGERICEFMNQFDVFRAFFAQPEDDSDEAVEEVAEQKQRAGMMATAMKEGGERMEGMIDVYSNIPGMDVAFKSAEGDLGGAALDATMLLPAGRIGGTLLNAARVPDKGGLTAAGRALQKHGNRAGSVFSKATGNASQINSQAESVLLGIINNPKRTTVVRHHARFGNIMDIKIPGGMGARYSADGKTFIHFLEP